MNDSYIYAIVALVPLSAAMVVFQSNPYHALVTRGILGAVAAFVYTVLGAADVALTEALVGTMLAVTLNAIAIRSSLVLRLGVLQDKTDDHNFVQLMDNFRTIFGKFHLRLELVTYNDIQTLHQALINKEVHATCAFTKYDEQNDAISGKDKPYHTVTRIRRIYDIMQAELKSPVTSLSYVNTSEVSTADLKTPVLGEHI
jgi:putative multicomponent Na+:H+ antiporter subunit B